MTKRVCITLSEEVVVALNSISRTSIPNKSDLINRLLYNYLSCSYSGSLA